MTPKNAAQLKAAVATLSWGASFVATKIALRECAPLTIIWIRFLLGLPVLFLLAAFSERERLRQEGFTLGRLQSALPERREWLPLAVLGFLGVPFHHLLQSTGLRTAQAATSAWIVSTIPVFIAILGWLFLKERFGKRGVLGLLLAATGVLTVVTRGHPERLLLLQDLGAGDFLVLLSAVNWAVFSVASRKFLGSSGPEKSTFWVMALGWLQTSLLFVFSEHVLEPAALSGAVWTSLLFLGIFCTGLAYAFWYDALRSLPASRVGVFLYLNPLSATVVAAVFLGEVLTGATLAGVAAIFCGVWCVNSR